MNSNIFPAIIAVGFNRPHSLKRLLGSLDKAEYPEGPVRLIISIDGGGDNAVVRAAHDFSWRFGEKEIIAHKERLGLRRHILSCGDLTARHDAAIILEDDMFVSPFFYHFALEALKFYSGDDRIAGVSLYSHAYNETAGLPFYPVKDDSDVFFMQVPSSWGQMWSKRQWNDFKEWSAKGMRVSKSDHLPNNVIRWSDASWKKLFYKYLQDTDKYFVYPRSSFCTNFGETGTHLGEPFNTYQVILQMAKSPAYRFKRLHESMAVYDSHCEILPENLSAFAEGLKDFDYEVDLYGTKDIGKIKRTHILTVRESKAPILNYACRLKPKEMNVICGLSGKGIVFAQKTDVASSKSKIYGKEFEYYYGKKAIKDLLTALIFRIVEKASG